jgi:hypothetical protein
LAANSRDTARARCSTQFDRLAFGQGVDRVLPLAVEVERRSAGDQNAEPRTARDQPADLLGGGEQVLEVVQQEQQPPAADDRAQLQLRTQRLRHLRKHKRRIAYGRERYPVDAVRVVPGKLPRRLQRQPRFATAAGAGQRDEPNIVPAQETRDLAQLALPPEKRG